MIYVIELEPGFYLANWVGDPGRTYDISSAKLYHSVSSANDDLRLARRYRKYEAAKIVPAKIVPARLATGQ